MRLPFRSASLLTALVCLVSLLSVAPSQANTVTGNQNPDLEVVVTLASSGSDPERATAGDTLTATWTVINKTNQDLKVNIAHVWEPPQQAVHVVHTIVTIPANGVYTHAQADTITSFILPGMFHFAVSATDDFGPGHKTYSETSALVTIY